MNQILMKLVVGFCSIWLCVISLHARETATFEEGNSAFQAEDFSRAAKIYQNLIASEGSSAALLYNLGNSQYRLGEYGAAILAYERARLLAPRDPDLRANLNLARKTATVFAEAKYNPWLDGVLEYFSRDEWSWWIVIAALWIGIMIISNNFVRLARPWLRKLRWGSVLVSGTIILIGGVILFVRRDEASRGVIISESASVRLSPFETATAVATPGAGRIVQMGEKNGDYYFVRVPNTDLQGWMSRAEVKRIEPDQER